MVLVRCARRECNSQTTEKQQKCVACDQPLKQLGLLLGLHVDYFYIIVMNFSTLEIFA